MSKSSTLLLLTVVVFLSAFVYAINAEAARFFEERADIITKENKPVRASFDEKVPVSTPHQQATITAVTPNEAQKHVPEARRDAAPKTDNQVSKKAANGPSQKKDPAKVIGNSIQGKVKRPREVEVPKENESLSYAKGIIIARFEGLTKYHYKDIDERGLSALVYDDALFNLFDQYGLIRIEHTAGDLLSRQGNKVTVKPSRERMMEVIEKYPTRSARGNIPEGYDPDFEHDYKLVFPENADVFSIIEELEQQKEVEYAEPDYHVYPLYIPNDPDINNAGSFDSLNAWHLDTIQADLAWDVNPGGNADTIIAVIDSGVDYNHEDLSANMWTNPGEIAGNGIDDDSNGYIDDTRGWDFVYDNNDPGNKTDHGTFVAGLAAAKGDNGIGIAGTAYNATIMPVGILDENNVGSSIRSSNAIRYAIDNDADVLNMSYGDIFTSSLERSALEYAYILGGVLVAGAGNNNSEVEVYPAAFDYVLAVAATNPTDGKASTSSYGLWVDISAPGSDVYSTVPENIYDRSGGTSAAAPLVSGVAALLLSESPSISNAGVYARLLETADNIDAENPGYVGLLGAGRVNAYRSISGVATIGEGWVEIGTGSASGGGISDTAGSSWEPSLALDANGNPVVAWEDVSSGNWEIYVKRFDGNAWVEMGSGSASDGGISDNIGDSWHPSITLDADGNPIVAWEDDSNGDDVIYVKRFDGTNWVEMGSGSASGGGISDNAGGSYSPSITLSSDGNPIATWYDYSGGDGEIYVKRFDGVNWVELGTGSASGGGISDNAGFSFHPSVVLDANGNSFVAWYDNSGGNYEIYVKRFDGSSWVEVGTGSASGGGISDNVGESSNPSIALDANGNPFVAWWDDFGGNWEIYVKRFDGVNWVEIGTGSASGGGISNNVGGSLYPSITIGSDGNSVVAWEDSSGGSGEIYVKRFDGNAWVEMGSGSSSGGGISDNAGGSVYPSAVLGDNDYPVVAWQDNSGGDMEIYIKKYTGNTNILTAAIQIQGGQSTFNEGTTKTFDASASTPGSGTITNYQWDFDYDGSTFTVDQDTGTTATAANTFNDDGSYTVVVRVSDDDGQVSFATVDIVVNDLSPTANAGSDQIIYEGQTISVSGAASASSPDAITLYEWDWTNNGTYDATGVTATSPPYNATGTYTVRLRVTDDDGSTDEDTLVVTVNQNNPPIFGPMPTEYTINENELITFTVSATDPDGDNVVAYAAQDLPAGATFNTGTRTFTWTPNYAQGDANNGSYVIVFEATDDGILSATGAQPVTINVNHIPGIIPTTEGSHTIGFAGTPSTITTASALLTDIQTAGADCYSLQRWDGSGWRTYYRGLPFGSFSLTADQGYTLNCRTSAVAGYSLPYNAAASVTYNLNRGTNFINMPLATPTYTSESFLDALNSQGAEPISLMHVDAAGNFITHYYNTNENIFDLEQGVPYIIQTNTTATVTLP